MTAPQGVPAVLLNSIKDIWGIFPLIVSWLCNILIMYALNKLQGVTMMDSTNQIAYYSLDKLHFDPKNPRLPKDLHGITDESKIIAHMLRDESLIELMKSIGQTNYSASEPLLVVPDGETDYTVVEGNRRLAALKLLSGNATASVRRKAVEEVLSEKKYSPSSIPCICYGSREEILDYLGYRHITGVKSWGALEKARYLKELYDRHLPTVGEDNICFVLAQMIGSRRDYVAKLLASYTLYERANNEAYFGIPISESDVDFSILSTAIGYENIYKFIGLSSSGDIAGQSVIEDNLKFLFESLYDPKKKIGESRQLKQLNAVLGNELALEEYKAGSSLQIASYYTSEPLDAFRQFVEDAYKALDNAKGSVERVIADKYTVFSLEKRLDDISKIARTIRAALQALNESEPD